MSAVILTGYAKPIRQGASSVACRKWWLLVCLPLLLAFMVDCQAASEGMIELTGGQTDAVQVCQTGAHLRNLSIRDQRLYKTAHRDAIQLIPPRILDKSRRLRIGEQEQTWVMGDQMTGTVLENVTVEGCAIRSPRSPLQGIFGGDGLFANLRLVGNRIQTASDHSITLNGLLDGEITDNILQAANSKVPAIRLYPARIGGNMAEEGMAYILSFADEGGKGSKLHYQPIANNNNRLSSSGGQPAAIVDDRSSIPDNHRLISFGLKEFRYYAFLDKFSNLTFGEYRRQHGGRDFAQLKAWLEARAAEYSSGKRIMPDALLGVPVGDERRTQILPLLRRALTHAVNSHALDHVSLSNFPETPVRAFVAKQLALYYGQRQPLEPLDATDKTRLQQMGRIRRATLKYLLPDDSFR